MKLKRGLNTHLQLQIIAIGAAKERERNENLISFNTFHH